MSEKEIYEKLARELDSLITEGEHLQRIPDNHLVFDNPSGSAISIPYSLRKKQWIEQGVSRVCSNFPNTIIQTDFPEIFSVKEHLKVSSEVITTDDNSDIVSILSALNKCRAFLHWCPYFDDSKLSAEDRANFWYSSVKELFLFIQQEVIGQLINKEDGRTPKTAMLHLYGRFFSIINSMIRLNQKTDCYLLTAALRMLLELYIDFFLIKDNCIDNGVEKFFHHDRLYKYRTASNLKRIDNELKKPTQESSALDDSLKNPDEKIALIKKLWDVKTTPDHWSRKPLEKRAIEAGCLESFRHVYYYGNMFIHSGYIDFLKEENNATTLCSYVYCLSLEMFCQLSKILCEEVDLKEKDDICEEIDRISLLFSIFQVWKSSIPN